MIENFKRKILKNGMVILFEKREVPVVSVGFAVRHGGINEAMSEKGISHFIEHMLYKGTKKRNYKQIAEELEKKGGILNGLTSEEITAFFVKLPSRFVNTGLDVLVDMIKNSLFDAKELEKERKVIFEEIKMRKDRPDVYVFDNIQKTLYTGSLEIDVIGTYETLKSIDRKKIVGKFKEIYSPNNLILCVVGDAEFDEIVKFAENNFGQKGKEIPEQKLGFKNGEKIETRKGIDQANLIFAYHLPLDENKVYAGKILSEATASGMSSRLFQELREKRNLAYAVKGGWDSNKRFAFNWIYVGCIKENVELVKKLIVEEFEKFEKIFSEKELNELKEQIVAQYQISMEDSHEQMLNLLAQEVHSNACDFYKFEEKIRKVKLKDVNELAKIASEKFSFFALVPED